MCSCGQPTVNGTPGYRWQPGDTPMRYPPNPPDLKDGDSLIFDEPGRCAKGIDSHAHHLRLVKRHGILVILVRHGGVDECVDGFTYFQDFANVQLTLDSDARYFLLLAIYNAHKKAERETRAAESERWAAAIVNKRIKRQKRRGTVRVWIEQPILAAVR